MSHGGPGHAQEPSAPHDALPLMGSLSNALPGISRLDHAARLPTIPPASPDKGASLPAHPVFFPLPKGHAHAIAIASSGSSTTDSLSELTSSSSRDSLPASRVPPKPARTNRRGKPTKANARWHRGSSDDTGPDRKPPPSQPPKPAPSPQPAHKQRLQPPPASHSSPASQARFMATAFGAPSGDARRGVVSPRPKGRGMQTLRLSHHVESN